MNVVNRLVYVIFSFAISVFILLFSLGTITKNEIIKAKKLAKKVLSVAIVNHYKRIKYNLNIDKSNVLMIGPSGSGKTKIATRLLEKTSIFTKLKSYTTQDPTSLKKNEWYNYITLYCVIFIKIF